MRMVSIHSGDAEKNDTRIRVVDIAFWGTSFSCRSTDSGDAADAVQTHSGLSSCVRSGLDEVFAVISYVLRLISDLYAYFSVNLHFLV